MKSLGCRPNFTATRSSCWAIRTHELIDFDPLALLPCAADVAANGDQAQAHRQLADRPVRMLGLKNDPRCQEPIFDNYLGAASTQGICRTVSGLSVARRFTGT
jgi:hypothetical protein